MVYYSNQLVFLTILNLLIVTSLNQSLTIIIIICNMPIRRLIAIIKNGQVRTIINNKCIIEILKIETDIMIMCLTNRNNIIGQLI